MIRKLLTSALLALVLAVPTAEAAPLAKDLFGAQRSGSGGKAQAIGSYARGCAAGLVQLPESGPTWQAMRLSRNRNWGHPELVSFVIGLSKAARQVGWPGLYIGDMSQPRGGPMVTGHASHQIGLDADIWMLPPASLKLSAAQREKISSISVRTEDQRRINGNWTPAHHALLKAAASDPRVDRIFVAAAVKIAMCNSAGPSDTKWLQKIRPAWGHNYHFHVRLKCPAGSPACQTQTPSVSSLSKGGSGCDETLNWWVTDALKPRKGGDDDDEAPKQKHPRQFTLADLPRQCGALVGR